jgi:hypothetical protein
MIGRSCCSRTSHTQKFKAQRKDTVTAMDPILRYAMDTAQASHSPRETPHAQPAASENSTTSTAPPYLGHHDGHVDVQLRKVDEAGHARGPGPVRARQAVHLHVQQSHSRGKRGTRKTDNAQYVQSAHIRGTAGL